MKIPSIEEIADSIEFLTYRDTYSHMLHRFLGWPVARGRQQIDEWLHDESFRVWFGHTSAVRDAAAPIARALFPAPLLEQIRQAGEEANMYRAIAEAIEGAGGEYDAHPDTNPSYDWDAAKTRVSEVIARYRISVRLGME
jgi:hypothetical protein